MKVDCRISVGWKKYAAELVDRIALGGRGVRVHNGTFQFWQQAGKANEMQLTTVPGCVEYNGAKIQMLDLPGIIEGAKDGKGRGRQVISVAKQCNLIFLILDVCKPLGDKRVIENELEGFGIRINKQPPNIVFRKKDKGGISITNTQPLTHLDSEEIRAVMSEYKINSADIAFRCDATVDDLIDIIEASSRRYIPVVYALNKIDAITIEELDLLYRYTTRTPYYAIPCRRS